jgi:hypothetical protein
VSGREVGGLVQNTKGEWMVLPPEKCGRGHLLAGNCLIATHVCSCQDRHLSWSCNSCDDVVYGPALGVLTTDVRYGVAW